jgi:hypothetical protein
MATINATYDVFIAHDRRDLSTANGVADVLRSHGLTVFVDIDEATVGGNLEDIIWQAMAESNALVVILPMEVNSSWLAFELGAAKAWNKSIYAVSVYSTHRNIPAPLRDVQVLPVARADEIATSIVSTSDPLSEEYILQLGAAYTAVGVTTDQLLLQPQQLAELVKRFNKTAGCKMSGEQVMRHILRLRKRGILPGLSDRNTTKR